MQSVSLPSMKNAYSVPITALRDWQLYQYATQFKHSGDTNLQRYKIARLTSAADTLSCTIYAKAGETLVAVVFHRAEIIGFDGWATVHNFVATTTDNTQCTVAYQSVTETGDKTFTVNVASAGMLEFVVIALKNVKSISHPEGFYTRDTTGLGQFYQVPTKQAGQKLLWCAITSLAYSGEHYWDSDTNDLTVIQSYDTTQRRLGVFVDFGEPVARKFKHGETVYTTKDCGVTYDAIEITFNEEE
jgi:hypothetical protein